MVENEDVESESVNNNSNENAAKQLSQASSEVNSISDDGSITDINYEHLEDEDEEEFRFESVEMLYPAFGNGHEKANQIIPA